MAESQDAPTSVPEVKIVVDGEPLMVGQWKAGLFDCFDSVMPNCLCSCFCPCVSFGQISARLGVGDFLITVIAVFILFCTGFGEVLFFLNLWYFRYKFRKMLQIPGSIFRDCCASFWCSCCTIAQMATHSGSYDPGSCRFSAKSTLPGYSTMLQVTPPVANPEPSKV